MQEVHEANGIQIEFQLASGQSKDIFAVRLKNGELEFHEVKGFWRDDARVKIKTAAYQYPIFHFIAVTKVRKRDGGGWRREEV